MTDAEINELETLRKAHNAAVRTFRATPSEVTKAEVNEAHRIYQKRRIALDPEFAEARAEATRRWREKKLLGISTGTAAKSKHKSLF